jgi:hypothetical protein
MNIRDIFKSADQKESEAQIKSAHQSLNMVGDMARKCLEFEDFKHYRKEYEDAERGIVDALIVFTKNFHESDKSDIGKYAFTVSRLITRLQDYRHLLNKIDREAKRKPNEDEVRKD